MSQTYHTVCAACQAVNRLPRERDGRDAKCGKCGERLLDGRPVSLNGPQFERFIQSNDLPVLADFWAEWCGPCKMMAPVLDAVAQRYERQLRVAKLDTERNGELAARYGIRAIPTLILFHGGHEVGRQSGAMDLSTLSAWLQPQLPT